MKKTEWALTASQTVGPFFDDCLLRPDARRPDLVAAETVGERIRVEGRVIDGDDIGVPDALVEIWQANAHGRYHHPFDRRDVPLDPTFIGFGRSGTAADGAYAFETIRPGRVPYDATRLQAAHISVAVFARGLLNHLYTRVYFGDDPETADDPVLLRVPAARRSTLLAARVGTMSGPAVYRFDIRLQGDAETVFFELSPVSSHR